MSITKCPKCSFSDRIKDGIVYGKQRYKCKSCSYRYTVAFRGKNPEIKRKALELYLEGLGFRAIGRILNVSNVAVYKWIKSFGESISELRSEKTIEVVEIDEMHSYIASKKTIAGSGLLLIDIEKSSSTALLAIVGQQQEGNYGNKWEI